jgi:hypothetical protein
MCVSWSSHTKCVQHPNTNPLYACRVVKVRYQCQCDLIVTVAVLAHACAPYGATTVAAPSALPTAAAAPRLDLGKGRSTTLGILIAQHFLVSVESGQFLLGLSVFERLLCELGGVRASNA